MSLSEDQLNQLMKFAFTALQGTINDRQEFARKLEEFRNQIAQLNAVKNQMPTLLQERVDHAVLEATKTCTHELTTSVAAATRAAEAAAAAYKNSQKSQPFIVGGVSALLGIAICTFAYFWTPSLSEIQDRRDQIAKLEENISQLQIQTDKCPEKNGKLHLCVLLDPAFGFLEKNGDRYAVPATSKTAKK
ncbi:hypothetical protein HWE04_09970 [Herbaspirillum sp. C7C2]|uniref:hypothetical protein n=1 Tax=Herbaspirillum sp. C7C2 TaxID=2736666 RepID=UPI001F521C6A|nr:hypothetical protein [Herbaspirillum sp. C7C2]MCI1014182.1 hypothetical protein [Herbaspirillum sp. C7C2]